MELREKAAQLPLLPGVYLYKDQYGEVIYVGKAKNLRARVRSYFNDDRLADAKTGTLIAEARDVEYILVDNNKEALALENNLIKQWKPRFNILLRDDKTFPYIKLTNEKYPRVYVTRRLIKDGSSYYGPYFPGNLAHRLVHFIHRHFKVPSCKVDFTRTHTHPCLEYHIHRCLGPCVEGLTTDEAVCRGRARRALFLEGRHKDLARDLRAPHAQASEETRFEEAAGLRDLISTVEEMEEKQKIAAAEGENIDILAYHAEPPLVAANLFHLRNGRIVDRREYFWEDLFDFQPDEFFSSLLKQIYLDQQYIPSRIHVPVDFEDREALEELLSEKNGPQGGDPDAAARAEEGAAGAGGDQREARVPAALPRHAPDVEGHAGGAAGRAGIARAAQAHRVLRHLAHPGHRQSGQHGGVGRRADEEVRLSQIHHPDGGGQRRFRVHARGGDAALLAAARGEQAFSELDPDRRRAGPVARRGGGAGGHRGDQSAAGVDRQARRDHLRLRPGRRADQAGSIIRPVLHLIQMVRDEAHRFAVTFHRTRRGAARLTSELEQVEGIGAKTIAKLLREFGSLERVREASAEELAKVIGPAAARRLREYYNMAGAAELKVLN